MPVALFLNNQRILALLTFFQLPSPLIITHLQFLLSLSTLIPHQCPSLTRLLGDRDPLSHGNVLQQCLSPVTLLQLPSPLFLFYLTVNFSRYLSSFAATEKIITPVPLPVLAIMYHHL